MTITIRPFDLDNLDDYIAMEAVERDVFPDEYETAAEHQHTDSVNRKDFLHRFLAEENGKPLGWALVQKAFWYDEPDQFIVNGSVVTARQGEGIGKQLYAEVQRLLTEQGAELALTWVREDMNRPIRFLAERSFEQKMRDAQSELDVTTFDVARFDGVAAKMAAQGVKLVNLIELAKIEPNWKQKVWEMRWPIRQDIPSAQELKQIPYDNWHKFVLEAPTHDPAGYVVAIAPDGEYIGWSNIETAEADPQKIYTGVTGTKRHWRRKGVATALKLAIIDYAKATGVTRIVTENEENNPMYNLNMALGFRPIPGWLTMKKVVSGAVISEQ